jgi:hypothetical protein
MFLQGKRQGASFLIMVVIMALVMSMFAISVSQLSRSRSSTLISDATEKQVLYLAEDAANQMIFQLNVNPWSTTVILPDPSAVGPNFDYDASYTSGVEPFNQGCGTVRGTGYLMDPTYPNDMTRAIYSKTVYFAVQQSTLFKYDGTTSGFSTLNGHGVAVVDGNLGFFIPNDPENRVAFGNVNWTDYVVHVTATLPIDQQGYGIYYRCDGKTASEGGITGYCFQFDPGLGNKLVVRKVTNGSEADPFQTFVMTDTSNAWLYGPHDITIAVKGDHHVISVDGLVILDFTDDWRTSGMAGLRSWGSNPSFSAISVTSSDFTGVKGTWRENY